MKKSSSLRRKAIMSALALSVGAASGASAVENALKDPLFSLKEINATTIFLAHDGEAKCGEGKCGEGKCGGTKTTTTKAKTTEGKCGVKKLKKIFKKDTTTKAKTTEGKCGEGKCGAAKKD